MLAEPTLLMIMPKTTFEKWRARPRASSENLKPPRSIGALIEQQLSRGGLADIVFWAVIALSLVSFSTTAISLHDLLTGNANVAVQTLLEDEAKNSRAGSYLTQEDPATLLEPTQENANTNTEGPPSEPEIQDATDDAKAANKPATAVDDEESETQEVSDNETVKEVVLEPWTSRLESRGFWLIVGGVGLIVLLLVGAWQNSRKRQLADAWKLYVLRVLVSTFAAALLFMALVGDGSSAAVLSYDAMLAAGVTFGIQILVVVLSFYVASLAMGLFFGPYSTAWRHVRDWLIQFPFRLIGIGCLCLLLCIFLFFSIAFSYATFHRNLEARAEIEDATKQQLDTAFSRLGAFFNSAAVKERERINDEIADQAPFPSQFDGKTLAVLNSYSEELFLNQNNPLGRANQLVSVGDSQVRRNLTEAVKQQILMEINVRQIAWEHLYQIDPWDWALVNADLSARKDSDEVHDIEILIEEIAAGLKGVEARITALGVRRATNGTACQATWLPDHPEYTQRTPGGDTRILNYLAVLQTQLNVSTDRTSGNESLPFVEKEDPQNDLEAPIEAVVDSLTDEIVNRIIQEAAQTERTDGPGPSGGGTENRYRGISPFLGTYKTIVEAEISQNTDSLFKEHLEGITKIKSVYKNLEEADDEVSVPIKDKEWNGKRHFCDPNLGNNFAYILDELEQNLRAYSEATAEFTSSRDALDNSIDALIDAQANRQSRDTVTTLKQLENIFSESSFGDSSKLLDTFNRRIADVAGKFERLKVEVANNSSNFAFCSAEDETSDGCVAALKSSCEEINQAFRVLTREGQTSVNLNGEPVVPSSARVNCAVITLDSNDKHSIDRITEAQPAIDAIFKPLEQEDYSARKTEAQQRLEKARVLAAGGAFHIYASELQEEVLKTSLRISKLQPLPSVRRSWDLLIDEGYVPFVGTAAASAQKRVEADAAETADNATAVTEENASALDGSGNRADIMDDAAFFLAVGIDGMIVVLAVIIAFMKSGASIQIIRDLEGSISQETLSAAHANIAREDPAIFSKISQFSRSVPDSAYPFVLELDSFSDENARRRAERVLGLLGPHAVLSGTDDSTYQMTHVAKAYIESLAGQESEFVDLTDGPDQPR